METQTQMNKALMAIVAGLLVLVGALGIMLYLQKAQDVAIEPAGALDVRVGDEGLLPGDTSKPSDDTDEVKIVASELAPVFFSTMTHMEGGWDFVEESEAAFVRQAVYLRTGMDYAERYDAILTFESEMPFSRAMVKWGDNVFQEALDRGMGVGTHCDTKPTRLKTNDEFVQDILERKNLIDDLVDSSENLGCAGAGGVSDWYEGMVGAGFKYIDGLVGFHYMALALEERPQGWNNQAISQEYYHNTAPVEDSIRYYPFRIGRVGFAEDPKGELVVSAGDIGQLSSIGDLAASGSDAWEAECHPNCAIDMLDVDEIDRRIRAFVETRDTSRVAKLQVYIPTEKFSDPGIELFFERLQILQDEGVIQWASQKQVYDAFIEWENR